LTPARLPGLDLLRAAAICWVLIYHASLFDLVSAEPWVVKFGWMGVDLFFALSGFLIAGQLLRPWVRGSEPDYRRFFARRLLRTLPAYLAVLAIYFLIPGARDRPDLLPLWRFLTFTQNLGLAPNPPKAFSHAWSLCVEEQFYLALPLAVMLIARRATARRVATALIAVLVLGMTLRGWSWLHDVAQQPFDPSSAPRGGRYMTFIYYPTWTRLDGLLAGIGAATVQTFRPSWWARLTARCNLLLLFGVAGVLATSLVFGGQISGLLASVFGFPLVAVSMGLLVIGASSPASVASRLAVPGVGALAAGAYSLYLSHKVIYHQVALASADWPPELKPLALVVALGGALIAGAVLYFAVERPFLRLRDRLTPLARVIPESREAGYPGPMTPDRAA
jgi:peptidoglycan/LPS O-acetylase OafA/YrhL